MNGPTFPLLMIHGLLGPLDFFGAQALLPNIEVLAPSLPGYGTQATPSVGDPLSLAQQAAWVSGYLRSRIGRPAWVLGHRVGGAVAMLAARMAPELVKAVISVEGNFTHQGCVLVSQGRADGRGRVGCRACSHAV